MSDVDAHAGEAADLLARRLRRARLDPLTLALLAGAADALCMAVALWFGLYAAVPAAAFHGGAAALEAGACALAAVALLAALNGYWPEALVRPSRAAGLAAAAAALVAALAAALAGRGLAPLALQLAVTLPLVVAARLLLAAAVGWLRDAGVMERRAVLAGGGPEVAALIRELSAPGSDIRVVAIFDDRSGDRAAPQVMGVPRIGRFAELAEFCRMAEVDLIVVTLPLTAERRLAWLLRGLRVLPHPVYLAAMARDRHFRNHGGAGLIPALPASFLPGRRIAKRAFDLVFAGLALAVLWPAMLLIALAVRLDSPGPALFRQTRHGFNDRTITVLKFRSMYADQADPEARRVVTRGDPRVTRVGRVLRRTSLDELPQLLNVIGGSLSLVGPRPHAVVARSSADQAFTDIVEDYSARHRLPPGVTGLAQVNGWRGEVTAPEDLRRRMRDDLYYIENWSLWLDLRILLRTPLSLLFSRRAY